MVENNKKEKTRKGEKEGKPRNSNAQRRGDYRKEWAAGKGPYNHPAGEEVGYGYCDGGKPLIEGGSQKKTKPWKGTVGKPPGRAIALKRHRVENNEGQTSRDFAQPKYAISLTVNKKKAPDLITGKRMEDSEDGGNGLACSKD